MESYIRFSQPISYSNGIEVITFEKIVTCTCRDDGIMEIFS